MRLAPAHSLDAAGAMCGIISPSMACWAARDEVGGGVGYSPMNDGSGDAFWLGVGSPAAIERQRLMADAVAPAFAAALRAEGPIDAFALDAQGIAMGDDCHMRHQATTMLLLRQTLPAIAEHAPETVLPTARLLCANGHFALTVTIAAARAALMGIQGTPGSSLVVFISRNGVDAAVQIAGLPGRWFTFPAPLVGDPLYRPGFSDADALPDIGDSALVECCGLGAAASAASPGVAAFLGGGMADAVERTRQMGDICVGAQRAAAHPHPRRRGHAPRGGRPRLRRPRLHAPHQHRHPAPERRRPDRRRHRPHAGRADPRRPARAGRGPSRALGAAVRPRSCPRRSRWRWRWGC